MNTKLKPADRMPGRVGLPYLGNFLALLQQQELFYWNRLWNYGKVFKLAFMGKKYAILVGPEAHRFVFKEGAEKLSSRLGWEALEPVLTTDMLLLQDGAEHRASRRLILPIFHHQAIASYFATMELIIAEAVTDWGRQGTINLNAELRKLTLTVAVRIFLGSEKTEEISLVRDWFATLFEKGNRALVKWDVPFTAYGQSQAARRKIVDYIRQLVRERQALGDADSKQDALGLLLHTVDEDGNTFSETQVINQAIGFLFAAHETTSNLMTWVLYELGNRPEWRDRLRNEYYQVVGDAPIQGAHLRQLSQMANILKEGERLYPPAPFIYRGVVEEVEFSGYRIPPGWTIALSPLLSHRLPEIYAGPEQFDPDRFAPPREEDRRDQFALIGFGGGAHSCLGLEFAQMEMKLILAGLLKHYDWEATPTIDEASYPIRRIYQQNTKLQAKLVPIETKVEAIANASG
jgi:retinoid hydroxylase